MDFSTIENIRIIIKKYLGTVKSKLDFTDSLLSVLYILYGIHKEYPGTEGNNQSLLFINDGDNLLFDIYSNIKDKNNNNLYNLYRELSSISYKDFENSYVELLKDISGLFSLDARANAEFFTPIEITSVLSYIINKTKCKSIFDPFCGTSSIIHYLNHNIRYVGQEWSLVVSILSRINVETKYGNDQYISCCDSIQKWNANHFDAIVTCPPLNMKLTLDQKMQGSIYTSMSNNLEEMLFSRAFEINKAKKVIALLPISFTYNRTYVKLRKHLVDNNLLEAVIQLPNKQLFRSSVQCVIVICNSNKKDKRVNFVNANDLVIKTGKHKGVLDFDEFKKVWEGKLYRYSWSTSNDSITEFDYILNPILYVEGDHYLKEGQELHYVNEILEPLAPSPSKGQQNVDVFSTSNFYVDFMGVLVKKYNTEALEKAESHRKGLKFYCPEEGSVYLLCNHILPSRPRFALYWSNKEFACASSVSVWKINKSVVLPEYIVYILVNNPLLKHGIGTIKDYMSLPLCIDSKEEQQAIIDKEVQAYGKKMRLEREADEKRSEVKTNISDLEHMLGTTQIKVNNIISRMERIEPGSNVYFETLKQLQDNIDYMFRMIHFDNASISSETFNMKEQSLTDYIEAYAASWNNYGGNYFHLSLIKDTGIGNITFDKRLLTVMLDAILSNAIRHGFHKNKHHTDNNTVEISLTIEQHEGLPFVVMRIANNGDSFKDNFTIDDYITKGRYSSETGRSGLGGYHVFEVVKGHHGYLFIDSNKVWNVIIEILLPAGNISTENLKEYEHDCI